MFFQQNGSKHLVQATAQQLQLRHICCLRGAFWYHVLLKVKKAKELGGRGGGGSHISQAPNHNKIQIKQVQVSFQNLPHVAETIFLSIFSYKKPSSQKCSSVKATNIKKDIFHIFPSPLMKIVWELTNGMNWLITTQQLLKG